MAILSDMFASDAGASNASADQSSEDQMDSTPPEQEQEFQSDSGGDAAMAGMGDSTAAE